jgi:hypothetical protein
MIAAFIKFWFTRDLKTWRDLRRQCRAKLPKQDQYLA